jgi:hypothetical protein
MLFLICSGPGSLLSICSPAGIAWVAERTGSSEFGDCAQMLTMDISGRRKPMTKAPFERNPEPDQEEAWKYCQGLHQNLLSLRTYSPYANYLDRSIFRAHS